MFENFVFENMPYKLVGYEWPIENPKKVMCIIHGIGEHAGRYDRMVGILNQSGIAAIAIDLPGHGLTDGKRGDAAPRDKVFEAVDEMLDYARKKYPDIPITLYGHSMGGNICLDYRDRGGLDLLPEKFIVSAPWLKLVKEVPKPMYIALKAASKLTPKAVIKSNCKTEDLGNMSIVYTYSTDPLVHGDITLRTALDCFDMGEALCEGRNKKDGNADGKPFLLMHGTFDKICDIEGTRKLAEQYREKPWFTYVEWPGYYHEIHNGGPATTGELVIARIRDFILT
ncbi:MAG: lysophospholipase [Firmicutes bacterium]|nr:lysophospholipase [Bacillota bacterium]